MYVVSDAVHRSKFKGQFAQTDATDDRYGLYGELERSQMLSVSIVGKLRGVRLGLDHRPQTVRR